MQKLQKEFKNIPTDTSLVCSSMSTDLNKEDTLSDQSIVLICNNPEENLDQHTGRLLQTKVYVISKNGNPLMPCTFAKSKRLVKSGKAKLITKLPFTIKLNFSQVWWGSHG